MKLNENRTEGKGHMGAHDGAASTHFGTATANGGDVDAKP